VGGGIVFESPEFFDVSPLDSTNQRVFIPHNCGVSRHFRLRDAKVGPFGLPVIFHKAGRMLSVEDPPLGPTGKPLIFSSSGTAVEVQKVTLDNEGKPIFFDKAGKPILKPRPILRAPFRPLPRRLGFIDGRVSIDPRVQEFKLTTAHPMAHSVFVAPSGVAVEVGPGDAGFGNDRTNRNPNVLMAQTGSLVYYATMVNDVFAYFLTGVKNGNITPSGATTTDDGEIIGQFPTIQTPELDDINHFAATQGVTLPHPNALTLEIKTSWVEASTLNNPNDHIKVSGFIPSYDATTPNQWTPNGSKLVQLALVGMHVVGSTKGHPEMIWATFEHFGNTPLATYTYNSTAGTTTVNQNTTGSWLFSSSGSTGPFNCALLNLDPRGNIIPVTAPAGSMCPSGSLVAPVKSKSDTLRQKAWGEASDDQPPIDGTATASNTEIISINHSILGDRSTSGGAPGLMPAGDVRGNYYLVGATWTAFGTSPTTGSSNQVGTSKLSNSTMETYDQGSDTTKSTTLNCFDCHRDLHGPSTNSLATTAVSHIFPVLQPLSFALLSVRVGKPIGTTAQPRVLVSVTNSRTGDAVAGAKVSVLDSDGAEVKASGITSAEGTVTLTYPRCFEVYESAEPSKPEVVTIPCIGSVQAADLGTIEFYSP
jgi:hypothetical protein